MFFEVQKKKRQFCRLKYDYSDTELWAHKRSKSKFFIDDFFEKQSVMLNEDIDNKLLKNNQQSFSLASN